MPDLPAPEELTARTFQFEDDGQIPNHPRWPLVVYKNVLPEGGDRAAACEELFHKNGWGGTWRNGIFSYHHYHSTSHEVLGVVRGEARVAFGGEQGHELEISAGDVAILPAGTGHRRLSSSSDFLVVGAYPRGQENYDLCTGEPDERPEALERIREVPLPDADPVYGSKGPLLDYWSA